jgi:hypothetical protein
MRSKGIGPQGLGLKGNNGYEIGSPAKKGLNTAGRKVEHMKSLAADQDKKQIEGRAADHVKVMSARGNWGTPIVERSKQASDYADYNEKKREKNIYKPARDKAAKKFDKATRYDDMLGRATNPGSPAKKLSGACWDGYEAIGMKKKGGRKVPNCVPKK